MTMVLNLTWRCLAAIAFLITSICFFLTIPVTSPKLSTNFLTMMSFSHLVVAREGGQVVKVHVGVDEAALHLHHAVVSLCVLLVIEEEEAICVGEAWIEEMSSLVRSQASSLWTVNLSLVTKKFIWWGWSIMYLNLGSGVCMDATTLFIMNKSGDMSTRSALSDR